MMQHKALLDAMRKKRFDKISQQDMDSRGSDGKTDELAPSSSIHESGDNFQAPDTRDLEKQNINHNAEGKGFKQAKDNMNSKDAFVNSKKPLHEPVDNMKHAMLSGDGEYPQGDEMGIDVHKGARDQGSKMTQMNDVKGKSGKQKIASGLSKEMGVDLEPNVARNGKNDGDIGDESEQAEFQGPQSKLSNGLSDKQSAGHLADDTNDSPAKDKDTQKGFKKAHSKMEQKYSKRMNY